MSDLQIIETIRKKIDVPFVQMSAEELVKNPHEPRRGYTLDDQGTVVGLRLNNTCFDDGELLGRLGGLTTLHIRYNDIHDFGFLKKLKKVTFLAFAAPYLKDFSFLGELSGLTSLDVSGNNLTDVSFLKELKRLSSLNISSNNIIDFSFLKELKGLSSLDISSNNIIDVLFLKELKGLSSLDISNNNFTDISFLKELKELSSLDISNNNFTDVSFLKELKGLTSLDISENNFTDVSFLKELKGLTSLDISENNFTDVSFLKELKELSSLDISNNNFTDVSFLKELKGLASLDISRNKLTDVSFLKELKGLTSLNISRNNLIDVSFLKELKWLASLDISENNLTDVSFLKKLKGLVSLDISWNKLTDVSFLKELKGLVSLDISWNKLTDVSFLKELKELSSLNISGYNLTDVSFLKEFKGLSSLDIRSNITDVSFLKELKGLSLLCIWNNRLTDVSFLKELKGLASLDISSNKLTDVSFLKELKGLTSLDIIESNLSSLNSILSMPNVISLYTLDTNVADLPNEILERGNIEEIRSFYRQKAKKTDTLYEAKVLFVGEPEAGKTSLMKRLSIPGYTIDPAIKEESTLGISIHWDYTFTYANKDNKPFKAHLWDFGGQHIQYYIHQFFLTEDALYILVLDDRKDSPNIDYWFRIIHLLGKESPVLVVHNRKNIESATGFDWNKYHTRYKSDFTTLEYEDIDLVKEDYRIPSVELRIRNMLKSLKHIGKELPASWLGIREAVIARKNENHITVSEFRSICAQYEIVEDIDQLAICNYLNTLGILLHFRNDETLADMVFINPEWISAAVYMILSDKEIEATQGRFKKSLLFDKWGSTYTYEEKNKLLTLMQKREFDLIYPVENHDHSGTFIAPLLLSDVAPSEANAWDRADTLSFRYRYKFMPVGIITRLIVRLNEHIRHGPQGDLVWKSGVILEKDGCSALVKSDLSTEGLNIIDISIQGDRQTAKDFLAHIRATVDEVHKLSFKNVDVELLVPCSCPVCQKDPNPQMFEFSRLQNYLKAGETEIRCEKGSSFRNVIIGELLGNIISRRSAEYDYDFKRQAGWYSIDPSKSNDQILQLLTDVIDRAKYQPSQFFYNDNRNQTINDNKEQHPMINITTIGNGVTFNGDFVIGEEILNSFNKVQKADGINNDLKELLKQLTLAIAPVAEQLPPDKAKELTQDLATLTNEATSGKPRRKWYELSLDGIKEACLAVGAIGKTAIDLVGKIGPLLG